MGRLPREQTALAGRNTPSENDRDLAAEKWRAILDSNQWPSASEGEPAKIRCRPSESRSLVNRGLGAKREVLNVPASPANHESFAAPLLPEKSRGLISPAEAADRLGVCRATVYKLCARGQVPHLRIGSSVRLSLADVVAALARKQRDGS